MAGEESQRDLGSKAQVLHLSRRLGLAAALRLELLLLQWILELMLEVSKRDQEVLELALL